LESIMAFNIASVTPNQASQFLTASINQPKPKPVFLWGPFGVGKSSIVRDVANAMGIGFIDARLSQLSSVDLRGLPAVDGEFATFKLPDWLPRTERDGDRGVLFLDELTLAAPSVQGAAYQLLQERELGDYKLPHGWVVLAAGNRPEDNAGVSGRQDAAVMNRFATHLNVLPDVDGWVDWAGKQSLMPELIAFIAHRGRAVTRGDGTVEQAGLLHEYPDGGCPKGHIAVATPRSWEAASNILSLGLDADLEQAAMQGCVGEGASAELAGFLRICRTLPDVGQVLSDPYSAPTPTELPTQYAMATILAQRCTRDNIDNAVTYANRMNGELAALLITIATNRDESLKSTQAYVNYKVANQDINI
jgi:SpoVK/Ycf46/Vps4 family AAA+-type ATPase